MRRSLASQNYNRSVPLARKRSAMASPGQALSPPGRGEERRAACETYSGPIIFAGSTMASNSASVT
jgi:hypothetical protein